MPVDPTDYRCLRLVWRQRSIAQLIDIRTTVKAAIPTFGRGLDRLFGFDFPGIDSSPDILFPSTVDKLSCNARAAASDIPCRAGELSTELPPGSFNGDGVDEEGTLGNFSALCDSGSVSLPSSVRVRARAREMD